MREMQNAGIVGGKMKLVVERYHLRIIPESEVDEAYIEGVLGLRQGGDSVPSPLGEGR